MSAVRRIALVAGVVAAAGSVATSAQDAPGRLVKLAPHAWAWIAAIDGSSNGAVFVGDSAVLVVDPGVNPLVARSFLAAVRTVTDRPVRHVVLTHWHPDHALGVTCLAGRSFPVYAHAETRRALVERGAAVAKAFASRTTDPLVRDALTRCEPAIPDSVVDRREIDLGGRRIQVFHPGAAHTGGDLIVWDPAERVLATGDVFMHQSSPDMSEARPVHWAVVLDSLVALRPAAVVAGHFGPSKPEDLSRFRDYLSTLIAEVRSALAAGTAPDQVPERIRMTKFADFAQYPQFGATIARNAARVVVDLGKPTSDR